MTLSHVPHSCSYKSENAKTHHFNMFKDVIEVSTANKSDEIHIWRALHMSVNELHLYCTTYQVSCSVGHVIFAHIGGEMVVSNQSHLANLGSCSLTLPSHWRNIQFRHIHCVCIQIQYSKTKYLVTMAILVNNGSNLTLFHHPGDSKFKIWMTKIHFQDVVMVDKRPPKKTCDTFRPTFHYAQKFCL